MGLFFKDKKNFDLEQHLQNIVGKYYEEVPEEQKNILLKRIVSDDGNKKYVKDKIIHIVLMKIMEKRFMN